jgi:hypothetical protein
MVDGAPSVVVNTARPTTSPVLVDASSVADGCAERTLRRTRRYPKLPAGEPAILIGFFRRAWNAPLTLAEPHELANA